MAHGLHEDKALIYEGSRVNLRAAELVAPGGEKVSRQIAEVADTVMILPLLDATPGHEKLVLIENERLAVRQTLWELPAGTLEAGEDIGVCAIRELEEETGYRAASLAFLSRFYPSPGFSTEMMHAYAATGLEQVGQKLDPTERITPQVVSLEQTMEMMQDGRIVDGKTIATLLFWRAFVRSA